MEVHFIAMKAKKKPKQPTTQNWFGTLTESLNFVSSVVPAPNSMYQFFLHNQHMISYLTENLWPQLNVRFKSLLFLSSFSEPPQVFQSKSLCKAQKFARNHHLSLKTTVQKRPVKSIFAHKISTLICNIIFCAASASILDGEDRVNLFIQSH